MHGEVFFGSRAPVEAADAFLRTLKHELLELDPVTLYFDPPEVVVGGGIQNRLYFGENLLLPITTATIRVTPATRAVRVAYKLRFTQLLWLCAFIFLISFLGVWLESSSVHLALIAALWLGGGNLALLYFRTRFQFRRFLRHVAQSVKET